MQREKGGGVRGWRLNFALGLENILFILGFFLSAGWLNRFGLVQSVLDFRN